MGSAGSYVKHRLSSLIGHASDSRGGPLMVIDVLRQMGERRPVHHAVGKPLRDAVSASLTR